MRTATTKPNLKPNEPAIRTLLHGCVGVLNGIAEMFPGGMIRENLITPTNFKHESPPNPAKRGRGNWKVQAGGKKAA